MEAITKVKFICGCGFPYRRPCSHEEAIEHSQKTGHTLAIIGEVRGEGKKKTKEMNSEVHSQRRSTPGSSG